MRTRAHVQTIAFLGVGLLAGMLLVGFRGGGYDARRPGLERYGPRAVAAVDGPEPMPASNAEVALRAFATADGAAPDISAFTRVAAEQVVAAEAGRPDRDASFLEAECDPKQGYDQPVLAGDR